MHIYSALSKAAPSTEDLLTTLTVGEDCQYARSSVLYVAAAGKVDGPGVGGITGAVSDVIE